MKENRKLQWMVVGVVATVAIAVGLLCIRGSLQGEHGSLPDAGLSADELRAKIRDFHTAVPGRVNPRPGFTVAPSLERRVARLGRLLGRWPEHVSLTVLDDAFTKFLLDETLTRGEKIASLWELFGAAEGPAKHFVLDVLATMQPIELVDEMLKAFHAEGDAATKARLMQTMQAGLEIANPSLQDADQLAFIGTQSEKVQAFFKDLALNGADPDLQRQALLSLTSVLPPGEMLAVLDEVTRSLESSRPGAPQVFQPITRGELMSLWFQTALATPEHQTAVLPSVLERLNRYEDFASDEDLRDQVYAFARDAELETEARPQLKAFLENHPPDADASSAYSLWLAAYAATSVSDPENQSERTQFIAQHLAVAPPLGQASILVYGQPDIVAHLSAQEMDRLIVGFGRQLQLPAVSAEEKTLLTSAIGVLSTHIAGTEQ